MEKFESMQDDYWWCDEFWRKITAGTQKLSNKYFGILRWEEKTNILREKGVVSEKAVLAASGDNFFLKKLISKKIENKGLFQVSKEPVLSVPIENKDYWPANFLFYVPDSTLIKVNDDLQIPSFEDIALDIKHSIASGLGKFGASCSSNLCRVAPCLKKVLGKQEDIKIGANGQWLAVLISGSVWVCNLNAQNPELKKLGDDGENFAMFGDPKEGRWLVVLAEGSFQVWNTVSWDKLFEQSADYTGSFRGALVDRKEGHWLAALTKKGIFVWSSSWGEEPRQLSDNTGFISLNASEEGRWLVAYTNRSVLVWDTRSWLVEPKQLNGKIGFIEDVVTDPKERWLAAVTDSGVFVWDSDSWDAVAKKLKGYFGNQFRQCYRRLRESCRGERAEEVEDWLGRAPELYFDPKGRWLVLVEGSKSTMVWDSNSLGTKPKTLRGCPEGIYHIEFDTDEGEWLAAYTCNERLLAWKSGLWDAEPRELEGHTGSCVQMICQQGWIALITEKEGEEKARFTLWDRYHIDREFVSGGDSGSP